MKIGQILMLVVYCAISVPVFNKIYNTSSMVIDEEFHLRQGKHYCVGNFSVVSEQTQGNIIRNYILFSIISVG